MLLPLPPALAERYASWDGVAAPTRDAATIVLLREGTDGPETYLLRRQSSMAFAPGMYVFPGGGLQDSDRDPLPWHGPDPAWWGERLGCDEATARGLVVAAVRETFEESGILFAGPDGDTVVGDTAHLQDARPLLDAGEVAFGDFLDEHGLVLRADLVGAWSHWITPAFEPRRYDTRFFVAAVPRGQVVGSLPGEADRGGWYPLRAVLAAVRGGEAAMLPPTWITCSELADVAVVDALTTAAARVVTPIEPRLVEVDGEHFLENPIEEVPRG